MANTIITKNSATASAVPTSGDLVQGELAVNVTDKRLFTENSGGTVVELGTNPSTMAVAGNATVGGTLGVTGLATLASSTLTANPTLTSGTANGVTYLNGSKVLTSGSALTFDGATLGVSSSGQILKLTTSGNTASGGLAYLRFYDSVGARGYIGYVGTDTMQITGNNVEMQSTTANIFTVGSEQMRLTSTGLGIGTSSPATKLNIGSGGVLRLNRSDDATYGDISYGGAGVGLLFNDANSDGYRFRLGGTNALVLDSAGNLGIGTSLPATKLHVSGQSRVADSSNAANYMTFGVGANAPYGNASISTTTAGLAIVAEGAGNMTFLNNGSERARIDASGNVGIGTSSPAGKLHVSGGASNVNLYLSNNSYSSYYYQNTGGSSGVDFPASQAYIWSQGGSERARIDSSGNLLVGGADSYGKIYARSDSTSFPNLKLQNEASSGYFANFSTNGNSTVGTISFTIGGTAYNTSSDYRLKNTVAPMTGALAKVALLKPVTYKWNADGSDGEGFIAHELAEVVPQCVTGEKDAVDAEGNPVYQGIDTSFLVATLTAAIQEQQAIIEQLKARLDAANL